MPQGYVLSGLSGYGYDTNTQTSIVTIGISNPAFLWKLPDNQVSIAYQYDSKIEDAWAADIGHSRIFKGLPQTFAFKFGAEGLHVGLAAHQVYNSEKDYGNLIGTYVRELPEGYVDSLIFKFTREELIVRYVFILSYQIKSLLQKEDRISMGLQFNYNDLYFRQTIKENDYTTAKVDEQLYDYGYTLGVGYEFKPPYLKSASLGFHYSSDSKFEKETYKNENPLLFHGSMPARWHFGFRAVYTNGLSLSINLNRILWHNMPNPETNLQNVFQYRLNAGYQWNKRLRLSLGALKGDYRYEGEDILPQLTKLAYLYVITGATFQLGTLTFDVSLADSRLISDKQRKQTIAKMGLGLQL